MNDGGASEVNEAELAQPTAVPLPGTGDRVDEGGQDEREDHELAELDALSHETGNDRGSGASESGLEEEVNGGDQRTIGHHLSGDGGVKEQALEIEPAIHHGSAVHQRITDEPVGGHREGKHEQVLGEDVDGVLLAAHPCFDHGEAGVHEDHQDRGHQEPHVVGQEGSVELRQLSGSGRKVEDTQAKEGQGNTSQPGQRTTGGQTTHLAEQELRGLQQARFLQALRPRPRCRSNSHQKAVAGWMTDNRH